MVAITLISYIGGYVKKISLEKKEFFNPKFSQVLRQ